MTLENHDGIPTVGDAIRGEIVVCDAAWSGVALKRSSNGQASCDCRITETLPPVAGLLLCRYGLYCQPAVVAEFQRVSSGTIARGLARVDLPFGMTLV